MMQPHILQQKAGMFAVLVCILLILTKLTIVPPVKAQGQVLQQMDVERVDSDRIFTFQDYPDYAAVYVESTISGLSIDSNMGIVADLSNPQDGVYRVIIDPIRQSLYFRAPGYREYRLNTGVLQERQVLQLNAEPLDRSITETGDLLIRSEPSGAEVTLDGIPGSFTTPHSFTGILAQTYNATLELEDYETEQIRVSVDPLRPTIRDVVLTPKFGLLNIRTPDATLFLSTDEVPEYRVSYNPGENLKLEPGEYQYRIAREGYEDASGMITISTKNTVIIDRDLIPTYGYLIVNIPNAMLHLSTDELPKYRVNYTPGENIRLNRGTYHYQISREGYEDAIGSFTISTEQTTILNIELNPTYGYLVVDVPNAELFIKGNEGGESRKIEYQPNEAVRVDAGTYTYNLQPEFYKSVDGTITIRPGENTFLAPSLEPDFATMRVHANVPDFRLEALDNNAPSAIRTDEINLEQGIRTVVVSSSGYDDLRLRIRARPGERIDTTVVLESIAERRQREQREQLPRGILNVTADVPDAKILIDGERRGEGEISLSMVPDTYEIELIHADFGTKKRTVEIPSAEVVNESISLRHSKNKALIFSSLIPGSGHLYTNRKRGYLYLTGTVAAAGFTYWSYQDYNEKSDRYDNIYQNYQQVSNIADATRLGKEATSAFRDQEAAFNNMMLGVAAFGGIYAFQILDLSIFSPRYGYRGQEMQAGIGPDGINLVIRF
jgi:hypothetical protein